MNIFIGILLLCALLGLWDKISGGKMGLAAEFDGGLASMASLALSIVGIYCIGVTAVRSNPEAIASFASRLPFDASVLIESLGFLQQNCLLQRKRISYLGFPKLPFGE